MTKNMWWGYIHKNGSIQVKRYLDKGCLYDAQESQFVLYIITPFEAECREHSITYIKLKLITK